MFSSKGRYKRIIKIQYLLVISQKASQFVIDIVRLMLPKEWKLTDFSCPDRKLTSDKKMTSGIGVQIEIIAAILSDFPSIK